MIVDYACGFSVAWWSCHRHASAASVTGSAWWLPRPASPSTTSSSISPRRTTRPPVLVSSVQSLETRTAATTLDTVNNKLTVTGSTRGRLAVSEWFGDGDYIAQADVEFNGELKGERARLSCSVRE